MELATHELTAFVCSDTETASYAFRCPRCGLAVAKPTPRRVVDVLVSSGVALHTWKLPAEMFERRPPGPALTRNDLDAFQEELAGEGWFERVVAMVNGGGERAD